MAERADQVARLRERELRADRKTLDRAVVGRLGSGLREHRAADLRRRILPSLGESWREQGVTAHAEHPCHRGHPGRLASTCHEPWVLRASAPHTTWISKPRKRNAARMLATIAARA